MFDAILSILQNEFHWSILETLAVIFSVIYVILATKENIWCWAAALISVGLYIYICCQAKLYAETGLQVFYFIMAIYGYFSWSKNDGALMISEWSTNKHFIIILSATLITFLLGFIFSIYTDAKMPIVDSFTTVFSVFATFMVVKKILSNWLYFIVIDIIAIHLYYSRDLHLTSFLFLIYTLIAIFGFLKWNRILQKHE